MITTEPSMTHLFEQLGLAADETAIATFIRAHQLPAGVNVNEAPFWNEGQRQFLSESLKADAAWAIVVDELNEALHKDAEHASADR